MSYLSNFEQFAFERMSKCDGEYLAIDGGGMVINLAWLPTIGRLMSGKFFDCQYNRPKIIENKPDFMRQIPFEKGGNVNFTNEIIYDPKSETYSRKADNGFYYSEEYFKIFREMVIDSCILKKEVAITQVPMSVEHNGILIKAKLIKAFINDNFVGCILPLDSEVEK